MKKNTATCLILILSVIITAPIERSHAGTVKGASTNANGKTKKIVPISITPQKPKIAKQTVRKKAPKQVVEVSFGAPASESDIEPLSPRLRQKLAVQEAQEKNMRLIKRAQARSAQREQPIAKEAGPRKVASQTPKPELNILVQEYKDSFEEDYEDYKE